MAKTKISLSITCLYFLTGCAGLDGFLHERTFINEMEYQEESYFVPGENFAVIPGDEGNAYRSRRDIAKRTPSSFYEKEENDYNRSIRRELAMKEKKLSPREYQRYQENSDYYPTDSEKIYFLGLSKSEQVDYLESKGMRAASNRRVPASLGISSLRNEEQNFENRYNNYLQSMASQGRSLFLKMSKQDVIDLWGRPTRVDVAGDPRHENERWSFYEGSRVKTVYFESGQVQGWAID